MQALARLRKAGFVPGISATGGLLIAPASRLTPEQRTYIRAHKVLLLEELRAECAPVPESPPLAVVNTDPHADRVAALVAAGWAIWNAQARAESEALPAWREKMEEGK